MTPRRRGHRCTWRWWESDLVDPATRRVRILASLVVLFLAACLFVSGAAVIQFRAHYALLLAAPVIALGISLGALLIFFVLTFNKE